MRGTHLLVAFLLITVPAFALADEGDDHGQDDDRAEHFEGEEAANLEEAVANLVAYNDRLEELLKQDELSAEDMNQIHNYSYTLENALQKVQEETQTVAANLEEVHLASERMDEETVRAQGEVYLETTHTLLHSAGE